MITMWLLEVFAGFFTWLLGTLPDFEVPTWIGDAVVYLTTGAAFVAKLAHVLPIEAMVYGITLLTGVWVITVTVRVVRMLLSLFTGGGGSAA